MLRSSMFVLALVGCGGGPDPTDPGECQPSSYLAVEDDAVLTGVALVACGADDPTHNVLDGEVTFALPLVEAGGMHRFFVRVRESLEPSQDAVSIFAGPCPFEGFTVCLPEGRFGDRIEENRIEPTIATADDLTLYDAAVTD